MIKKIVDWYRKPKIFKLAIKYDRDLDGDFIVYKGTKYMFHYLQGWIKRVN